MQKYFETGCFYCSSPDHPRFKCPKLTAVLTERGLRRVNGQWVATPDGNTGSAPGSQSGEEWYCSMLDGGSDGGSMEAVFSPPPVPAGFEQRPPRTRRTAAARLAQAACPCAGAHVGTCGILAGPPCESWPSRFAHPTAWDALGDTAGTSDDEFPELHRALADAVTAETVHERLSRAPKREPQAARKAARRTAVPLPASVQSCFKGRAALNVVGQTRGEQTVRAVVDSGAAESVTPPGVFADPVVPSAMSRAGQSYTSANGSPIANLGRTTVHFRTPDGDRVGMHFQVGEGLTQPLVSVAGLVDAGNLVAFDKQGGWIHQVSTGRRIRIPRVGNTFFLDMKVSPRPEEEEEEDEAGHEAVATEAAPAAFRRPV